MHYIFISFIYIRTIVAPFEYKTRTQIENLLCFMLLQFVYLMINMFSALILSVGYIYKQNRYKWLCCCYIYSSFSASTYFLNNWQNDVFNVVQYFRLAHYFQWKAWYLNFVKDNISRNSKCCWNCQITLLRSL